MKSIADIPEKINDRLNPIVVKELRQAVQGKFLIVVLICFLCLQLLTMGLFLTNEAVTASFNAGLNVFRVLLGILFATCLLFVPAYTGIRLASERADANVDLPVHHNPPTAVNHLGQILCGYCYHHSAL